MELFDHEFFDHEFFNHEFFSPRIFHSTNFSYHEFFNPRIFHFTNFSLHEFFNHEFFNHEFFTYEFFSPLRILPRYLVLASKIFGGAKGAANRALYHVFLVYCNFKLQYIWYKYRYSNSRRSNLFRTEVFWNKNCR